MPLSTNQAKILTDAINTAFTMTTLRSMLRDGLNKDLETITPAGLQSEAVSDVVARADGEGWAAQLITAARDFLPHDPHLQEAAASLGSAPRIFVAMRPKPLRRRAFNEPTLEKIVLGTNSLLDVADFRTRLNEVEYQVCRIEIAGEAVGTGFLISPSLLMTCYHVVESLIRNDDGPEDFIARFDYKKTPKDVVTHPGRKFTLAPAWLVAWSPYNPQEAEGIEDALPNEDELDFAILRLAGEPGSQPVSEIAHEERPRGWIELSDRPYPFPPETPLFIVQHPAGDPLKLALDSQAIIGVNANGTRVRYRTNTDTGSSGSPCFNNRWHLVALHHRGIVKYNEGIPTSMIAAFLKKRSMWPVI